MKQKLSHQTKGIASMLAAVPVMLVTKGYFEGPMAIALGVLVAVLLGWGALELARTDAGEKDERKTN